MRQRRPNPRDYQKVLKVPERRLGAVWQVDTATRMPLVGHAGHIAKVFYQAFHNVFATPNRNYCRSLQACRSGSPLRLCKGHSPVRPYAPQITPRSPLATQTRISPGRSQCSFRLVMGRQPHGQARTVAISNILPLSDSLACAKPVQWLSFHLRSVLLRQTRDNVRA